MEDFHRIKQHHKGSSYEKEMFKKGRCGGAGRTYCRGRITACSGKEEKQTDGGTEVVLNEVAHSIFYAPMYVAIEEGYFAEEGIELTLVTGFGADKTMTAVLTDQADIGFMGSESTIYTYAGGTQDYVVNFAQLTQRAGNFLVSQGTGGKFHLGYAERQKRCWRQGRRHAGNGI